MTIDEFIIELRKYRHLNWGYSKLFGSIMAYDKYPCRCPITVLSKKRSRAGYFPMVAKELGLKREDMMAIALASAKDGDYDRNLRRRIIRAVGLSK